MRIATIAAHVLALAAAAQQFAAAQQGLSPAAPEPGVMESRPVSARPRGATALFTPRRAGGRVRVVQRPDGGVRRASGFATRAYGGTPEEAAARFLQEFEPVTRIRPGDLRTVSMRRFGDRTYVRLQRSIGGVPVRGSQVLVQLDAANSVNAVTEFGEDVASVEQPWTLTESDAIDAALPGLEAPRPGNAERRYVIRDGKAVPAWRVIVRPVSPAGTWEVLVSAVDGSILEKQNLRRGQTAEGYAYPKNPVVTGVERVRLENLTDPDRLTSEQTVVYSYLPALRGEVKPNTYVQLAARTGGNFLFPAESPNFSEVQLYYAMERVNGRFRDLGFPGWDKPLGGVVLFQDWDEKKGKFVGSDNAYFTSEELTPNGGLFFYLTGKNGDMSLDADAIFHEFTHAIVNYVVGSEQSVRFQALNEGTADYFSDSFMDDAAEGEYVAKLFGARTAYLRTAANDNAWPHNIVGEPHADGNIWSGALWDVRTALGAPMADNIAINALLNLFGDSEFYDAALAAVDAAQELYGDDAAATVEGIMIARGLLTDAAQTASESLPIDPKRVRTGHISAATNGRVLLGYQQFRVDVPNRATRLDISLQASGEARFYVRYRTPITIENGKIAAEQVSGTGVAVSGAVTLNNFPELQAGTYYIAVVNTTANPIDYQLRATVEGGSATSGPAFTMLENGETGAGSAPSGPFLASRRFAVEVPEGTQKLRIEVVGDQDVDLFVSYGKQVSLGEMGYPEADWSSESDAATETITLRNPNGGAIPAGRYSIGVLNYSNVSARFKVTASYN